MKLHEALRKLVTLRGRPVLGRSDLASLVSAEHAFDGCPAMRDAFEAFVSGGYAARLSRAGGGRGLSSFGSEEERVRKAMAENGMFWQALTDYFTDSVAYALGLRPSVLSPFDPGFRYSAGIFYPSRMIAAVTRILVLAAGITLVQVLSGSAVQLEIAILIPIMAGILLWLRSKK